MQVLGTCKASSFSCVRTIVLQNQLNAHVRPAHKKRLQKSDGACTVHGSWTLVYM